MKLTPRMLTKLIKEEISLATKGAAEPSQEGQDEIISGMVAASKKDPMQFVFFLGKNARAIEGDEARLTTARQLVSKFVREKNYDPKLLQAFAQKARMTLPKGVFEAKKSDNGDSADGRLLTEEWLRGCILGE